MLCYRKIINNEIQQSFLTFEYNWLFSQVQIIICIFLFTAGSFGHRRETFFMPIPFGISTGRYGHSP